MENLHFKIKKYLENNSKTEDELYTNIKLENNGDGDFISLWNVDGVAKPTDEQLDALSSQATTLENNAIAVSNRQKEYGSPEKMIEYITENGLEAWQSKVQEIKTKYPKESE